MGEGLLMAIHNGRFEPITENSIRILESGDTRITEALDTRITDSVTYNSGVGILIATPRVITFYSRMYIKINSLWKEIIVNAKHSSIWQYPLKVYKKTNEIWKRAK